MAKQKIDYALAKKIEIISNLKDYTNSNSSRKVIEIKLEQLSENPHQPRFNIDESKLQELADSIETNGLLQPIIITNMDTTKYTIIAGHRRVMAHKLLKKESIEAIVLKNIAHEQLLLLSIIENLQRVDMEPIENALSLKQILDDKVVKNQARLAKIMGVSSSWLSRLLSVLKLDKELISKIRQEKYNDVHVISALNRLEPSYSNKIFDIIKDKCRKDAIEYIKKYNNSTVTKKPRNPIKTNKNKDKFTINLKDIKDKKIKEQVKKFIEKIEDILDIKKE